MNPLMMLMFMGGGIGMRGMLKKALFYGMFGWIGLILGGGRFSIKDFLLVPMLAPMVKGIFGTSGAVAGAATTGALAVA